jgi:probable addiction module antidote protein
MKASRAFRDTQIEQLRDPNSAAIYLEEALIAGDISAFKLALRNVAEARLGGVGALSELADLNRESLYRTLSNRGNPTLETLTRVMRALGLRLSVAVESTSPQRPQRS